MSGEEDLIAGIEAVARAVSARVIMPLTEPTALSCIRHRTRLEKLASLPLLPDADTFSAAVDKASLACELQRLGLPAPRTWVHAEGAPLPDTLPGLQYPLVVKPSRGEFGVGIKRADSSAEFGRIVESFGVSRSFVVQELVTGQDVDCSLLADKGRIVAYTIQQAIAPPDREFAPAPRLKFVNDGQVLAVVERLVAALGWSGIAHIDLLRDARTGKLLILEINARIWGSLLASVAAGVNFPALMCLAALGHDLPPTLQKDRRFFTQGIGFKPVLRGLRKQPDGFKFSETNLPFILSDPLPTLAEEFNKRIGRIVSA